MPLDLEQLMFQFSQDVSEMKSDIRNIKNDIAEIKKDETVKKLEERIRKLENFQTRVITWGSAIAFIVSIAVSVIVKQL